MHNIKAIRDRLGVTQQALATGLGCTQGNVGHYENGQMLPPAVAKRLIEFAAALGLVINFDHVYGDLAIPAITASSPAATPEPAAREVA